MPRKDTKEYRAYMREYMRLKRQGLTEIKAGINKDLNVGVRGLEPPTSASQTLRASHLRYTPTYKFINKLGGGQYVGRA